MITQTQMYWLVKLDDMRGVITGIMWLPISVAIIIGILAISALLASIDDPMEKKKEILEGVWKCGVWCASLIVVAVVIHIAGAFVPSTKQMAAIIVVPKIANSEKVQTVGNQLYDLAVEWMNELKPKKGEGVAK